MFYRKWGSFQTVSTVKEKLFWVALQSNKWPHAGGCRAIGSWGGPVLVGGSAVRRICWTPWLNSTPSPNSYKEDWRRWKLVVVTSAAKLKGSGGQSAEGSVGQLGGFVGHLCMEDSFRRALLVCWFRRSVRESPAQPWNKNNGTTSVRYSLTRQCISLGQFAVFGWRYHGYDWSWLESRHINVNLFTCK